MDYPTFKEKLDSMLPDVLQNIRQEAAKLYDSGAVDTESFPNDFRLPKMVLVVALERQAWQYTPPYKEQMKDIENLRHF